MVTRTDVCGCGRRAMLDRGQFTVAGPPTRSPTQPLTRLLTHPLTHPAARRPVCKEFKFSSILQEQIGPQFLIWCGD